MEKRKIRNDIILIAVLIVLALAALIPLLLTRKNKDLIAKVYVQNEIVETIDLSKKEDKYYYISGTHGIVTVHTKDGAIAVVDSNCPHHDCINMGYVKETNRPIVCAYNAVYIEIVGEKLNDIEVG